MVVSKAVQGKAWEEERRSRLWTGLVGSEVPHRTGKGGFAGCIWKQSLVSTGLKSRDRRMTRLATEIDYKQ